MPKGPEGQEGSGDVNLTHILLICLGVVAIIFVGSIALGVFYVEQNRINQPQISR